MIAVHRVQRQHWSGAIADNRQLRRGRVAVRRCIVRAVGRHIDRDRAVTGRSHVERVTRPVAGEIAQRTVAD